LSNENLDITNMNEQNGRINGGRQAYTMSEVREKTTLRTPAHSITEQNKGKLNEKL
jgi:hypothetical protein